MKSLRLRPGLHYAPIDAGVYFSSARSTFVMRGPPALFRVVDACVPLLEDGAEIEDLVAAVAAIGGATAGALADHLLDTFDSRKLILHLDRLQVAEPSVAERDRFAETLAYLETFRDDPYADFRRVRKARVLLAGPADALGTAVRGLLRAGIGQLLVATPDPDRLGGLASRFPEVRLVLCRQDGLPMLVTSARPDAAVLFTSDSFPTDAIRRLPPTCIAVPVRLGKDLAIVGPAVEGRNDIRGAERLWSRALSWCRLDGDDLLVRPSGDLLAGALAGQCALDALIGLDPGRVHLVHGPDLSSDSITPTLVAESLFDPPTEWGAQRTGVRVTGSAWVEALSQRWGGLFRVSVPGDLPQLPLALTVADGRSTNFDGRTVGFGPDQEASTNESALEALRQHCAGLEWHRDRTGGVEPDRPSTPASGLDETGWLLDGALRLLVTAAGDEQPLEWAEVHDAEARRLWRALEDHELTPVRLAHRHVPGFGWTLISVYEHRGGPALAKAWGPTLAAGAVGALSAAIATRQARRIVDTGYQGGAEEPGGAGYRHHLHGPHQNDLAAQVGAWLDTSGARLRGQRLLLDPVTGPLPVACGMVWLDG